MSPVLSTLDNEFSEYYTQMKKRPEFRGGSTNEQVKKATKALLAMQRKILVYKKAFKHIERLRYEYDEEYRAQIDGFTERMASHNKNMKESFDKEDKKLARFRDNEF